MPTEIHNPFHSFRASFGASDIIAEMINFNQSFRQTEIISFIKTDVSS